MLNPVASFELLIQQQSPIHLVVSNIGSMYAYADESMHIHVYIIRELLYRYITDGTNIM